MPEDVLDFTTFDECDSEMWDVATSHSPSRWHRLYDEDRTLPARKLVAPSEQQFRRKKLAKYRVVYEPASGAIRLETEVEAVFRSLADEWLTETMFDSSPTDKFLHPAYLKIIGMGAAIVPLLLREVQNMTGDWFLALRSITREDPAETAEEGRMRASADAWLTWGRQRGLI